MKVYTRTGDKGQTSLLGGKRVSKADKRLEAYGTIDELNSFLGLLRSKLHNTEDENFIFAIQKNLFTVGAILATPTDYKGKKIEFDPTQIETVEKKIDQIGATLPPFKEFIVYGDNEVSSVAHICRLRGLRGLPQPLLHRAVRYRVRRQARRGQIGRAHV